MGLLLLGGLLLETACSVREDRMPCPCQLCLDFVGPEIDEGALAGLMVTSMKGFVWKDTVDIAKVRNGYSVSVPQTLLHVRSWIGADSCASESGIVIPYGRDCPRVYMHDSDIKAEGEYITETVTLRKNHCVLTLSIEGEGRLSSDLRLKGNVAGYDAEGQPLYGNFSCLLEEEALRAAIGPFFRDRRMRHSCLKWMMEKGTVRHSPWDSISCPADMTGHLLIWTM